MLSKHFRRPMYWCTHPAIDNLFYSDMYQFVQWCLFGNDPRRKS